MCGILCGIFPAGGAETAAAETARWGAALRRRGPDRSTSRRVEREGWEVSFRASLLQVRGVTEADGLEHGSETGYVLAFNGEIYEGVPGLGPGRNDTRALARALDEATGPERCQATDWTSVFEAVSGVVDRLHGPWSLIFWHAASGSILYGRDELGRRSLLRSGELGDGGGRGARGIGGEAGSAEGAESEATAVTRADPLPFRPSGPVFVGSVLPGDLASNDRLGLDAAAPLTRDLSALVAPPPAPASLLEGAHEVPPGLHALKLLAGGGAARLFAPVRGPVWEARRAGPPRALPTAGNDGDPWAPAGPGERAAAAERLGRALAEAVRVRCVLADAAPGAGGGEARGAARIAVLFSGGLDSAVLAALASDSLPPGSPVDLLSACFAGGESADRKAAFEAACELAASRPAARFRLVGVDVGPEELARARPRLAALCAPLGSVMDANLAATFWAAASGRGDLLFPEGDAGDRAADREAANDKNTGDGATSEGTGSDGAGNEGVGRDGEVRPLSAPPVASPRPPGASPPRATRPQRYRSKARVVLVGTGADELLCGYGRHRTVLRERGWAGLAAELEGELSRLHARNLGRDDRAVADSGREARHPFLDARVVAAVASCRLPALADPAGAPGFGDKRALRDVARSLGLPGTAARVKRAAQFGSGISRATNLELFGSGRAANARSAGTRDYAQAWAARPGAWGWEAATRATGSSDGIRAADARAARAETRRGRGGADGGRRAATGEGRPRHPPPASRACEGDLAADALRGGDRAGSPELERAAVACLPGGRLPPSPGRALPAELTRLRTPPRLPPARRSLPPPPPRP